MDILEQLKKMDLKNATPNDVRKVLYSVNLPTIRSEISKGAYILRARRGDRYTKRSQMTYCPVELCTSLQRATLAGRTMFYGVLSDSQLHLENARIISSAECSKLTRDGIKSIGREKFTVSYWEVIKPLKVVSFIADSTFPEEKNNKLLTLLREVFNDLSFSSIERDLIRFVSSEFSKVVTDNREYLISATISSDIIDETNIDGIIFPSVQLEGQAGLNIALSPKAVNTKLRFKRTIGQTLYKNKEKTIALIEKATGKNGENVRVKKISNQAILETLRIKNINDLPLVE